MGLAPTGLLFTLAMIPNSLWQLAMPTLPALMTQHVSEYERGRLQGANMSVASIARTVHAYSLSASSWLPFSGTAFLVAGLALCSAGHGDGWSRVGRAGRA